MIDQTLPPAPRSPSRVSRVWTITRGAMPYLVATMFTCAAMAWYFFVFVPAKLEYFAGLRIRTLAVASGQVKSKIDSLHQSLDAALHPRQVEPQAPRPPRPPLEFIQDYLRALIPDLRIDENPGPGLKLTTIQEDLRLFYASIPWQDVVNGASAVSARDFEDLLVADAHGTVLWQREKSTPRVANLKELISVPAEPRRWLSYGLPVRPSSTEQTGLPSNATVSPVNLAGVSTYAFVQSVTPNQSVQTSTLYVAGLVSRHSVERQAMRIPIAWVVYVALPVVLLILALPFIKLATLTPSERYSLADIVWLGLAALCIVAIGAGLPFGPAAIGADRTGTLTKLAEEIETRFAHETEDVLELATVIRDKRPLLTGDPCEPSAGRTKRDQRCGLWRALDLPEANGSTPAHRPLEKFRSLELDVAIWVNPNGDQVEKWTTKTAVTAPVNHRSLAHFQDLKAGRTWRLEDGNDDFIVEPLRSPTTAEMGFVFGVLGRNDPDQFFILNVRPQSVVDTVVPPGYGFAVIGADGRVLFHSEDALSLEENFLDEVDNRAEVQTWAALGHKAHWTGNYHGRRHWLHVRPMARFIGCPWRIVTFQEMEPALDALIQQQSASLRLWIVNLLVLLVLIVTLWVYWLARGRHARDLLLFGRTTTPAGIGTLIVLSAAGVVSIVWSYSPRAAFHLDVLYGWFVALPILALGTAVFTRTRELPRRQPLADRWRIVEVILLLVLTAALPAIGFARITYRVQEEMSIERWLEETGHRWAARRARVRHRVATSAYSKSTKKVLSEKGFARDWDRPAGATDEPTFSYVAQIERVRVLDADDGANGSSSGQSMVRALVTWWPFGSDDSQEEFKTHVVPELAQFRLVANVSNGAPVLSVALEHELGVDVTWLRGLVGIAILIGAAVALCWARRRLITPSFLPPQTLEQQLGHLSGDGSEALFLIGPPRTGKDQAVRAAIVHHCGQEPADRIRLLDRDLTEAFIDAEVKRIDDLIGYSAGTVLAPDGRAWLHVSNLESQLITVGTRMRAFQLLERLLEPGQSGVSRVVVVTTSVDPIANFAEIFRQERQGVYNDIAPEVELSRLSLLLSRFRRSYRPLLCEPASARRWSHWLRYQPATWKETLEFEAEGWEPLGSVTAELVEGWTRSGPSRYELERAFTARALAMYQLLWTSCTRSEKLVLIQLAQEGMVNPKCADVVARLVAKGIVVAEPGLTVFNYTFRRFLRNIERDQVVEQWEHMEGNGLWVTASRLVSGSILAGGLFFLTTQDLSIQSLLVPIVSGTGLFGLPVVRDLIAKVTGRSSDASSAG